MNNITRILIENRIKENLDMIKTLQINLDDPNEKENYSSNSMEQDCYNNEILFLNKILELEDNNAR